MSVLLGATERIAYQISREEPFQTVSATYTVKDSTGAVVGSADTPATIYNKDTDTQEMQFLFTPTAPGIYRVTYKISLQTGEVFIASQIIPVTSTESAEGNPDFTDIYAWVRSRLQDSVTDPDGNPTVPNGAFDLDIASEMRHLFGRFPDHPYAELTGEDRANASEAIGLLASIRLQVPLSTGGLVAPITYENVTTKDNARITRQTAQISNTSAGLDERVRWQEDADRAWARVSFVIPTLAASFRSGFGVSLPRRGTVSCPGHRYPERMRRFH